MAWLARAIRRQSLCDANGRETGWQRRREEEIAAIAEQFAQHAAEIRERVRREGWAAVAASDPNCHVREYTLDELAARNPELRAALYVSRAARN